MIASEAINLTNKKVKILSYLILLRLVDLIGWWGWGRGGNDVRLVASDALQVVVSEVQGQSK